MNDLLFSEFSTRRVLSDQIGFIKQIAEIAKFVYIETANRLPLKVDIVSLIRDMLSRKCTCLDFFDNNPDVLITLAEIEELIQVLSFCKRI